MYFALNVAKSLVFMVLVIQNMFLLESTYASMKNVPTKSIFSKCFLKGRLDEPNVTILKSGVTTHVLTKNIQDGTKQY